MLEKVSSDFSASADKPGGLDSISTVETTATGHVDVESTVHPLNQPEEPQLKLDEQSQNNASSQSAPSNAPQAIASHTKPSGDRPSSSEAPTAGVELASKLPYRPNQQVEFLNLQVETEALLHQIHLHQRQRQSSEHLAHRQLATSTRS